MERPPAHPTPTLADLPLDELVKYGKTLGLSLSEAMDRGEVLRRVRERQELLLELERDALLDVVVWARVPVRRTASKEELAVRIASLQSTRLEGLSDRGLRALARLRGLEAPRTLSRDEVEHRLKRQGGFWARVDRSRRRVAGALVSRLVQGRGGADTYQFLPETETSRTLRESIEDAGLVGGIAQRIRGAADHYLQEKLDEIERRIDHKLDEIDRRLGEWRDQEILNRLRIVKVTLVTAIVVALISLGYDYLRSGHRTAPADAGTSVSDVANAANGSTAETVPESGP